MSLQNITLISFGYFDKGFLDRLVEEVSREFQLPVRIKEGHIDLSEYYDPIRRQYNGNTLLKEIDSIYATENIKTLGLFNVDLFIPILTFIFGQAYLFGSTGIVSLYRLSNERYGMVADDKILLDRTIKESIHELGHTLGLIHCQTSTCVMRSSTYVEDLDLKSSSFCIKCKADLVSKIG